MENLYIETTKYTPEIKLDLNGSISIIGKSYPENTFDFYEPIMKWLEDYLNLKNSETLTIDLEIIYFNSSSSKLFFDFFDLLEESNWNNEIKINWIFDIENESAQEVGEDFIEDFPNLDIQLIVK